jgi:hypothetical protein
VLDAVCDRYGLDRAVMAPPKKDRPAKKEQSGETSAEQTAEEGPTEEKIPAKKQDKKK